MFRASCIWPFHAMLIYEALTFGSMGGFTVGRSVALQVTGKLPHRLLIGFVFSVRFLASLSLVQGVVYSVQVAQIVTAFYVFCRIL